jgi:hypothetical protein
MGEWSLSSRPMVAIAIAIAALTTGRVLGQAQPATSPEAARVSTPAQPRTAWGDPDLQGTWNYATLTPLERPKEFEGKDVLTAEEVAEFERRTGQQRARNNATAGPDWWDLGSGIMRDRRTSLILDPPNGRIPPLTPDAQKRAAARADARRARGAADSFDDLGLNVRCISWATAGPPMLPGVYNNNVQFVQTREYLVILNEMIHDARIVPLDGRPHGSVRQWMGDSRGRWERDTLIVDTINFTDKVNFRGSGENLHLVERFTRIDADTIEYRFTAEDPTTWTMPWTAAVTMTRIGEPIFEYACHEGNYRSMVGIFSATRAEEQRGNK